MKPLTSMYRQDLRNLNLYATACHIFLVILIGVIVGAFGSPFFLNFETQFFLADVAGFSAAQKSPVCTNPSTNTTTTYTSVFDYFSCLQAAGEADFPEALFVGKRGTIKVWILLLIFEIVTALSHLRLVFYDYAYNYYLDKNLNPARWIEYSITNTIMVLCLLALVEIYNIYLILHVLLASIFMNFCGGWVYELLDSLMELRTVETDVVGLIRQTKFVLLVLSWAVFVLLIVMIFDKLNSSIHQYSTLANASLWNQLFDIVRVLNIGIVVAYSAFPILHAINHNYLNLKYNVSYATTEKGYIFASIFAKSFLTITILAASVQRS